MQASSVAFLHPADELAVAADDCFCNSTLMYALGAGKLTALPAAVQSHGAGQQQAAELRQTLCSEARAQVQHCLDDPDSSSREASEWVAVFKSLHKGRFVEQDTAFLLSTMLHVTVYVIANGGSDHLQVTKYAGEARHCIVMRCAGWCCFPYPDLGVGGGHVNNCPYKALSADCGVCCNVKLLVQCRSETGTGSTMIQVY